MAEQLPETNTQRAPPTAETKAGHRRAVSVELRGAGPESTGPAGKAYGAFH